MAGDRGAGRFLKSRIQEKSMSRVWLAALGAAAVIACGGDDDGNGPTDFFPDVAGVYTVQGQFEGVDPSDMSFTGMVTIEQESLESSLLTGTANITIVSSSGNTTVSNAELLNAGVDLGGNVAFTIEQGTVTSWDFSGEKAGDVLTGTHDLILGSESFTGTWSGQR
jgi:hypothetical protein